MLGLPAKRLAVEVAVPGVLFLGDVGHAAVDLRMRARYAETTVDVLADLHADLLAQPARQALVSSEAATRVEVPLVALRRGTAGLERLWLGWSGPLGLVRRQLVRPVDAPIAVVPDIGAVRRDALQLMLARDARVGQRSMRLVGEGSEFESMREYVQGLDHRAISWKASARHRKLICQEYRAERNHQVVIAFDTGRLMAEPLGGVPKLDHAIHAGLAARLRRSEGGRPGRSLRLRRAGPRARRAAGRDPRLRAPAARHGRARLHDERDELHARDSPSWRRGSSAARSSSC